MQEGPRRQVAAATAPPSWSTGTKLKDVAVRKKLVEGGKTAIDASQRPDDRAGQARSIAEPASVRKTLRGPRSRSRSGRPTPRSPRPSSPSRAPSTYPDATFTLRLAFGVVKGYEEDGKKVPPWTTFGGTVRARRRSTATRTPFDLPRALARAARTSSTSKTPFNFVCTADIIGGNSGSPVVNRDGEVVGIIFDGNIQSLVLDFVYTDEIARAVSVHSAGIMEALSKIYDANELADETRPIRVSSATVARSAGKSSVLFTSDSVLRPASPHSRRLPPASAGGRGQPPNSLSHPLTFFKVANSDTCIYHENRLYYTPHTRPVDHRRACFSLPTNSSPGSAG